MCYGVNKIDCITYKKIYNFLCVVIQNLNIVLHINLMQEVILFIFYN